MGNQGTCWGAELYPESSAARPILSRLDSRACCSFSDPREQERSGGLCPQITSRKKGLPMPPRDREIEAMDREIREIGMGSASILPTERTCQMISPERISRMTPPIRTTLAVDRPSKREDYFRRYNKANPQVYELFERFCREMIEAGLTDFGAPVVWERIRWETSVVAGKGYPFKLPNILRPYYSREFQRRNPDLAKHVKTRRLRAE